MVPQKKFLIIGSGGVGAYFGGKLAQQGNDITFLARGEHYDAIKKNGLQIQSVAGNFIIKSARVINSLEQAESPDVVFFCVKTYDTENVATALAPIVRDSTVIISLQNGVENDSVIRKYVGKGAVYPGLAQIISAKIAPGIIAQTAGPRTVTFGKLHAEPPEDLIQIQEIMRQAGIEATASATIDRDIWHKFIFIVSFAGMTSLCRSPIGKILEDNQAYDLYERSVRESIAVAEAHKIPVAPDIFEKVMEKTNAYRGFQGNAISSMARDLMQGTKTEIESLSGTLVNLAQQKSLVTPIHQTILTAVRFASRNA